MHIILTIGMPPMGKARPRVVGRHAYMPKSYMEWKKKFGTLARMQTKDTITGKFHINVAICTKSGKMRSDILDVSSCILDALQECGIIESRLYCTNVSTGVMKDKLTYMVLLLTSSVEQ